MAKNPDYPANRRRRPPASEIQPDTPIWCPSCRQEFPASDFSKNSTKFSGLTTWCKRCVSVRVRTEESREYHRQRNKERWEDPEYRQQSLEWQRARRERLGATFDLQKSRARLQAIIDDWKAQGCVDCGYSDLRALDPDHLDPATKSGNLSFMVRNCASAQRIRDELAKCEVRCGRCHRRRTQEQRPAAWRERFGKLPPSWQRMADFQRRNDEVKMFVGCVDCGWWEWARGLDWDHIGSKRANVSQLIANGRPWEEIEAEIANCEVRCVNCHRIKTAERRRVPRPSPDPDEQK